MLSSTLDYVRCPTCRGELILRASNTEDCPSTLGIVEVRSGHLACEPCGMQFPILAGVAILVEDVGQYLVDHVKGIAKIVSDSEIPEEFREAFLEAKYEIQTEHIEEDLEAERVNSLYVMTHYLHAGDGVRWWAPISGEGSPLIDKLVRQYWDQGPFARIEEWVGALAEKGRSGSFVELGCGTGGLFRRLRPHLKSYLGVDSAFASVALGRHLALGMAYPSQIRFSEDLLHGTVSRDVPIPPAKRDGVPADLIVGDVESPPLALGAWDMTASLNMIDMLAEPEALPALQYALLKENGYAIHSCPYVWHENVARHLREMLPDGISGSAQAVEWLCREAGFEIEERLEHVPWLFFKHVRQLEIYSAHLFLAVKK